MSQFLIAASLWETIANSVFPQTSGSMTYNLTMLVVVCVVYFVADCGLRMGMRKGRMLRVCFHVYTLQDMKILSQQQSHEFSLLRHHWRGKMCKHKHALKGKMIRGTEEKKFSWPQAPTHSLRWETKSSFHLSHGPATPATNAAQRDAEKTMRSWAGDQHGKDYPGEHASSGIDLKWVGFFRSTGVG